MKMIGIIILVVTSSAAGCFASAELKSRAANMRQVRLMIEKLRLMIRYEALEVSEISRRLGEDESLGGIPFLKNLSENVPLFLEGRETFCECWRRSVRDCGVFSPEETALLFSIGDILGSCDCEGQLSALSLCGEEADRLAARSEEAYRAKGRLYRSLGAVAGALIAIIII